MAWGSSPLVSTTFQSPTGGATGLSNANGGSALDTTGASLLILKIGQYIGVLGAATIAVTDNKSNTWTSAVFQSNGSNNYASQIFYCKSPTVGSGHVLTLTCAAGTYFTAVFEAWPDGDPTAPLDVTNSGFATSTAVNTGSVTPNQANSLVVTAFANGTGTGASINGGFATPVGADLNALGNAYGGYGSYLVQTSIAAANPQWSTSASLPITAVIAVFIPAASSGISGTAAWTEAQDTWAGTGTVLVSGSAAWTEAQDTWAGTGGIVGTGTAAWTEVQDTWAGTGTVTAGITGSAAWTEGPDVWAGSGAVAVDGSAAWTEGPDIWAATGNVTLPAVTGTASWTEAADTWAGTGTNGILFDDGHDPGVKKRRKAAEKREKERIKEDRDRQEARRQMVIDAFERTIEGKPEIPEYKAEEIVNAIEAEHETKYSEVITSIDFEKLLARQAKVEELWAQYLETDDEEVLVLL